MAVTEKTAAIPLGVVIRKQPGVTRWAKWIWRPVAVLPGAGPAEWRELKRQGEAVEYHAATLQLEVHRAETESYRVALSREPPSVYVVLRPSAPGSAQPFEVFLVTASAFEAQDYLDSGEEIVEPVPMPPALIAWLSDFVGRHHRDEPFVKRKRRPVEATAVEEEGRGDPRVTDKDVFRHPDPRRRKEKLQ